MPPDGQLEPASLDRLGTVPFGIYVHVPFCTTRCGYCDFNTYTAVELGSGASRDSYAGLAIAEVRLARKVLGAAAPAVSTVFFGGGTPTLLPPGDLGDILAAIEAEFGLASGAEVTTEANPESVEGFAHVSLDLIYGTPGESGQDWERSVRSAIEAGPDHISAYALTVEEGTRLAARVRRGELAPPDDDEMADRYLAADELLASAGMGWYEISNWAAAPGSACRHNLLYWSGGNWWGVGPGAHSHVGGVRWWNVRHPAAYASRIAAGASPGQAREVLTGTERRTERIMLETRLASGCRLTALSAAGRRAAATAVHHGLAEPGAFEAGRVVLTPAGRLLADAVIRGLTE